MEETHKGREEERHNFNDFIDKKKFSDEDLEALRVIHEHLEPSKLDIGEKKEAYTLAHSLAFAEEKLH